MYSNIYSLDVIDVTREKRTIDYVDISRRPRKANKSRKVKTADKTLYAVSAVIVGLFCLAVLF